MTTRIAITKRQRFDVFSRDKFTCQYCGKTPPEVTLHVDHIIPVKEGGGNEPENLRTACDECNLGKGAKLLSEQGCNDLDALSRAQEVCEAIKMAKEFSVAREHRAKMRQEICNHVCELCCTQQCNKRNVTGIARAIEEFDAERVMEWLDVAAYTVAKGTAPNETDLMKYFYGILRHIREGAEQ